MRGFGGPGTLGAILAAMVAVAPLAAAQDIETQAAQEGLVEVENTKVDIAYVRPGIDWSRYASIQLRPLIVTEEARDATPESSRVRSYPGESWVLRDKDVKVLEDEFARIMRRELEKGDYSFVDEARADALIIVPALIDIYMTAPIEDTRRTATARGGTFTEYSGSLTIAVALADGETGAVIGRAVDTRYPTRMWRENTRIRNISDVRQIYGAWGRQLRKRLQELRSGAVAAP